MYLYTHARTIDTHIPVHTFWHSLYYQHGWAGQGPDYYSDCNSHNTEELVVC